MILISVTSSRFRFNTDIINDRIEHRILVHDGSQESAIEKSQRTTHLYNKGLIGSYASRNKALLTVSGGKDVLLIDDDVVVLKMPKVVIEKGILYAPYVSVKGEPTGLLERWYKFHAFDQEKYIYNEGFAPTICWYFVMDSWLFNDSLLSGGDVEASQNFDRVILLEDFVVQTNMRTRSSIIRKLQRQVLGLAVRKNRAYIFFFGIKSILLGSGSFKHLNKTFFARYVVGYFKFKFSMMALLKWQQRSIMLSDINSKEVSRCL